MKAPALAALLAVSWLLASSCGGQQKDAGGVAPLPTPSGLSAAPEVIPASAARSRWGWKGTEGDLAFFSAVVTPGSNPLTDMWSVTFSDVAASCSAQKQGDDWDLSACDGLPQGASVHMLIRGDKALDISIRTVNGRQVQGTLSRVEDKAEPAASSNVKLLWQSKSVEANFGERTGLYAADGIVFAPHFGGIVELLDATTGNRLSAIDIASAPGTNPSAALEVTARDGMLYVATTSKGVLIYDVRDPAKPQRVGQFMVDAGTGSLESVTNIHTLFLGPDGRTLYAVNQSHATTDLRIIDVSNPASPREAGRFIRPEVSDVLNGFHDIEVIYRDGRSIGFLDSLRSGLFVLDLTDPQSVTVLGSIHWDGTLSHSGAAFEVGGKLYYAHDDEGFDQGMTVLDMSDLSKPSIVSRYQTRRGTSIHNIDIVGNIAYLSYYVDGLRVVDLSDPSKPREIAHYDTVPAADETALFQGAWGVKYMDGRVFVSDIESGIFAFHVDIPK